MRSFFASAVVGATVASGAQLFGMDIPMDVYTDAPYGAPISQTMKKNGFGMSVEQNIYANSYAETTVRAPHVPFDQDFTAQTNHIETITQYHKAMNEGANDASPVYTCANRNPYGDDTTGLSFLPAFGGAVTPTNTTVSFEGTCFSEITLEYKPVSDTAFDVTVTTANPKKKLCSDVVMFANTEIQHVEVFFFKGTHTMHFETKTQEAQDDMKLTGINAFNFCETAVESIESLWNTLKMFVGGVSDHPKWPIIGTHVPKYMEQANVKFIKEAVGHELVERTTKKVEIDPSLVQSGDFFGVMRLDGLDQIIMYGTGALIGHNVMALRMEDDELYIVESQDSWYWPTAGLQRTKYADWMKQAEDASFHVTWHRMRDDVRAKFDVDAAINFFHETEGMPYGYHNFLYGWIDTAVDNWPPMLPVHFVPVMFRVLEEITPTTAYNFYAEALNLRLGTTGLDIEGVVEAAYQQGKTLEDVMAMVEQDGWRYNGNIMNNAFSYVCSAYVAAIYKAGGLLDETVNATEFATRDVYVLDFFDTTTPLPEQCTAADPTLPYCQLLGNYRVELDQYSKTTPYPHMFETCEINFPTYERNDQC